MARHKKFDAEDDEFVRNLQGDEQGDDSRAEESGQDGEGDEDHEDEADIDMRELSMEELQKLKQKLGIRGYREALSRNFAEPRRNTDFKRANKNRPREMSSKRPPKTDPPPKSTRPEKWDPRFDERFEFKPEAFRYHYKFLDDVKAAEIERLRKKMKKSKDLQIKQSIKSSIQRLENQLREQKRLEEMKERERVEKQRNIERLKQGKLPYFAKKTERRAEELEQRYVKLREDGKLEKYMKQKRRRLAGEDKKKFVFYG